jgi:colicin import membrane protein
MTAAALETREEPGFAGSIALAIAVHAVLVGMLLVGVRWQNSAPDVVAVELWEAPPPPPVAEPPKRAPKVEPPAPPKPEPRLERPEIARPEPPKPKPEPKAEPKPRPEPEPVRVAPRPAEVQQRLREELAREQAALALERERSQLREQLAREASAARARALAEYEAKIRAKVRGNILLPPELQGNPEAVFLVVQLPTGEVLSARLAKSSGHKGYDDAVERAILKSSPLPRPGRPELFSRELRLTFRPRE